MTQLLIKRLKHLLSIGLVICLLSGSIFGCSKDLTTSHQVTQTSSTTLVTASPTTPNSTSVTTTPSPATVPIPASTPPRNIILIGWDGAQRNHVKECLRRGDLPNLQQLISEGAIVDIDVLRTTDTKAGWTQILTGYEPEVTGVYSNARYQPIPKGYTVFERLEQFFGADNFVTVAVIGKKEHVDADPPRRISYKDGDVIQGQIITEGGVKYQLIPVKPYYYTQNNMDIGINGLRQD